VQSQPLREDRHRGLVLGLALRHVAGGIEHIRTRRYGGGFVDCLGEIACAAMNREPDANAACLERGRGRRSDRRHQDTLWNIDACRGRAARDEQQRRACRADASKLRPVMPLMFDARDGERAEALPPQLDDQAVGMRLRLRDYPGERQRRLPHEC
jgi:hypothetical protein